MAEIIKGPPISENPAFLALMSFYAAEERYSASGEVVDRIALLNTLHPDIVLYQPESLPYGGVWRGRESFGAWLDTFVKTWTNVTAVDPEFHACGDQMIVAAVTLRATARSTGIEINMPICQLIRFFEDRPIEWRNFAWDTAKMNDALKLRDNELRP